MAATLLSVLGLVSPPDTCPITQNNFYPTCSDYLSRTYDFIIVGGGTAGCVLANRLTEDPGIQVLLLEDGDYPSRETEIPLNFIFLQETDEDWAFKAEQPGYFKGEAYQVNPWPQGHALGGSSSINAMIYAPGFPVDYDYWAELTQDPIWSWDNMQFSFDRLHENVKTTQYRSYVTARTLIGLGALELGIPVNEDDMFGYNDHPTTIYEDTRFSMAEAYLRPIKDKKNLCVMVKRRVNKIIIEGTTAVGVEVQDPKGVVVIKPKREIIITAGAINSPKLLMLSGIGPQDHLKELGIPVYADLPVGKYLEDHLIVPVIATIFDVPMPPYNIMRDAFCATGTLLNNIELANFIGFFNTKGKRDKPDIEFIHFEFLTQDPTFLEAFFEKFGIIEDGEMFLQDLDPKTPPRLFPHYFDEGDDAQVVIDSINQIVKPLLSTTPFIASDLFRFEIPECDEFEYESDKYWRCYFTYLAGTIYHPAGTCRMGFDRVTSVVDSRLRVWGIKNLRVADSSTIPALVSGHSNLPTCALAENAADIIKVDNDI
ncbi:uncharacterized GMC-type oxidoreductase Mb1310-like [Atheta coriaria]|uniref:uncharacterized GMC-type oxidoreductase Mb1310-like n=1 Tax=Dalotia coriaria TaxID=877792 RepID=UPI0031F389E7